MGAEGVVGGGVSVAGGWGVGGDKKEIEKTFVTTLMNGQKDILNVRSDQQVRLHVGRTGLSTTDSMLVEQDSEPQTPCW